MKKIAKINVFILDQKPRKFKIKQRNNKISRLLNVRVAGDLLYGKLLVTWLSLVMSMTESFCAVLFPTRCIG